MKTAMKRLLSFVLVAMMLVSVLPFQASAATDAYVRARVNGELVQPALGTIAVTEDMTDDQIKDLAKEMAEDALYVDFGEITIDRNGGLNVYVNCKAGMKFYVSAWAGDKQTTIGNFVDAIDTDAATLEATAKAMAEEKGIKNITKVDLAISDNGNIYVRYEAEEKPEEPKPEKETWTVKVVVDGKEKATGSVEVEAGTAVNKDTDAVKAIYNEAVKGLDVKSVSWSTEGKTITATVTLEEEEYTITFRYCGEYECKYCTTALSKNCDNIKEKTVTTVNQELTKSMIPSDITERYGYILEDWVNAADKNDDTPAGVYTGDATFDAVYEKSTSNTHRVTVYGVIYRNGETTVLSTPLAVTYASNKANLLSVLNNQKNEIQDTLKDMGKTAANGYAWNGNTFYDDEDLESKDVVDSADQVKKDGAYYVKVEYKGNDKVQLYIHTSKTMTIKDTITLKTYTPGESITKSAIKSAVKKAGWSYSNIKTYGLQEWEKVVEEESSAAADEITSFTVEHGETEIHVYLYGASSSGSVNNSDNPKTGDTILMAVTAMGLSATALAAVYFFMKKRAI